MRTEEMKKVGVLVHYRGSHRGGWRVLLGAHNVADNWKLPKGWTRIDPPTQNWRGINLLGWTIYRIDHRYPRELEYTEPPKPMNKEEAEAFVVYLEMSS